jgi:hypothetical protein
VRQSRSTSATGTLAAPSLPTEIGWRYLSADLAAAIWSNDRYQFRETYEVDAAAVDFFDRENLAIEETSKKFAESVITDLREGF